MEGEPGSMSAYSRGKRDLVRADERDGPGPAKYGDRFDGISGRQGTYLINKVILWKWVFKQL